MMSELFQYGCRNEGPRAEAWKAHYVRKGCHPVKAERVAWDKVRRSHTWPPA